MLPGYVFLFLLLLIISFVVSFVVSFVSAYFLHHYFLLFSCFALIASLNGKTKYVTSSVVIDTNQPTHNIGSGGGGVVEGLGIGIGPAGADGGFIGDRAAGADGGYIGYWGGEVPRCSIGAVEGHIEGSIVSSVYHLYLVCIICMYDNFGAISLIKINASCTYSGRPTILVARLAACDNSTRGSTSYQTSAVNATRLATNVCVWLTTTG